MLPLKKSSSILQKLKSLFLSSQNTKMQTIFQQIELTNVQLSTIESNETQKYPQLPKTKQRQTTYRQTVDYQQVKKKNDCLKQIEQLKNNIKQMLDKNEQIYDTILKTSSNFTGVLFFPKNYNQNFKITKYDEAKLYQRKLLVELDKLYEQNCLLEKQLNRAKFIEQHEQKQKQDTLLSKVNHYQFLRNVWQHNKSDEKLQIDSVGTNKSEDFIERLNKKVAIVKLGINRILKEQQSTQSSLCPQIEENVVQKSVKYQRLLRLYEKAMMKIEEQSGIIEQRLCSKQKEAKVEDKNAQIQNLNIKIKELQEQIRQKDECLLIKEKELQKFTKKQESLRFVFRSDEEKQIQNLNIYEIRVYWKENIQNLVEINNKVEYYQSSSNFSEILNKLIQQSEKITGIEIPSELHRLNLSHKRSLSDRRVISQFSLDQIQKDRMNLIKKTNILTQNLSQYNTARRNMSKHKVIDKTPQLEKQKQNIIIGKFQSVPREDKPQVDFPNFSVNLASAEIKTKFVRSSNRHR